MRHAQEHANQMRMQALLAMGKLAKPKLGLISSYDPATYSAKVTLQPEGTETGWLPICTMLAGNGFGVYFGPSQNDQCAVSFQEGDREVGFITGFLNSLSAVPPNVSSGHLLMQDAAGSMVALTNDGKILSTGDWHHTGAFTASGEGTFNGGHTVSQHTHTQPADSHGDTEQPTNKPTG